MIDLTEALNRLMNLRDFPALYLEEDSEQSGIAGSMVLKFPDYRGVPDGRTLVGFTIASMEKCRFIVFSDGLVLICSQTHKSQNGVITIPLMIAARIELPTQLGLVTINSTFSRRVCSVMGHVEPMTIFYDVKFVEHSYGSSMSKMEIVDVEQVVLRYASLWQDFVRDGPLMVSLPMDQIALPCRRPRMAQFMWSPYKGFNSIMSGYFYHVEHTLDGSAQIYMPTTRTHAEITEPMKAAMSAVVNAKLDPFEREGFVSAMDKVRFSSVVEGLPDRP